MAKITFEIDDALFAQIMNTINEQADAIEYVYPSVDGRLLNTNPASACYSCPNYGKGPCNCTIGQIILAEGGDMGLGKWLGLGSDAKAAGEGISAAGDGIKKASEGVGGIFTSLRTAITGVDPVAQGRIGELLAQAEAKIGELTAVATAAVNEADAKSENWWQNGWRPALAWACVLAMFLYYPTRILTGMGIWVYQSVLAIKAFVPTSDMPWVTLPYVPEVGMTDILGLVGTLLGSSVLREIGKAREYQGK